MSYSVLTKGKFLVAAYSDISEDWQTTCPALEFLHTMAKDANYSSSAKKYRALFQHYAVHGGPGMTTEMFHEADKQEAILEFIKGSLRVLCFVDGNIAILTNGYIKKGQKADTQAVAQAVRAKQKYFNDKGK